MSRFMDVLQTVLSGDVFTSLSFLVDMMDVSLELLDSPSPSEPQRSLARWVSSLITIFNNNNNKHHT